MKVETSKYLKTIRPQLKSLLTRLLSEYEYVSILAEDAVAKRYSVSKTGTFLGESPSLTARGVVVKVYDGKGYSEYAFNQVNEKELDLAVETLKKTLIPMTKNLPEMVSESTSKKLEDIPCEFHESTEYEIHPTEIGDEKILKKLDDIVKKGLSLDERIINCAAQFEYQQYSKLFLSEYRDMLQDIMWSNGMLVAFAANGEKVENCYKGFSVLGGAELLEKMETGLDEVVNTTIELLDSVPIIPGEYECICTPEVTGMIVHEAFGHGVEMDMFVKKRALAEEYIGKRVASDLVTMHDGAAAAKECATYFFDDEGVLAQDTVVIEKGILKSGISDSQAAMHLGTKPTGNGRREMFSHKAYTRMTNTFFEGGNDKYEDMLASISYGFQLEHASSGMEDPKNWGIQCMVNVAREIKDGKFTGKICSPIVLTGYVPDLLQSISMVSEEVVLGGCGACGKGYKEWVKVSDGGPYIKAKIRLG